MEAPTEAKPVSNLIVHKEVRAYLYLYSESRFVDVLEVNPYLLPDSSHNCRMTPLTNSYSAPDARAVPFTSYLPSTHQLGQAKLQGSNSYPFVSFLGSGKFTDRCYQSN